MTNQLTNQVQQDYRQPIYLLFGALDAELVVEGSLSWAVCLSAQTDFTIKGRKSECLITEVLNKDTTQKKAQYS